MTTKITLLMSLTELSEQIRHSKKNHGSRVEKKHHTDIHSEQRGKDKHHKTKNKMSFTAKRTICMLLDEQSINQRNISKRLGVSAQTVSEMVKTLEAKEIIAKTQGDLNNENIITLTEKGRIIATETNKNISDRADRIFAGLSSQEIEALGDILAKISRNNLSDTD